MTSEKLQFGYQIYYGTYTQDRFIVHENKTRSGDCWISDKDGNVKYCGTYDACWSWIDKRNMRLARESAQRA